MNTERVDHWVAHGAQLTERAAKIVGEARVQLALVPEDAAPAAEAVPAEVDAAEPAAEAEVEAASEEASEAGDSATPEASSEASGEPAEET